MQISIMKRGPDGGFGSAADVVMVVEPVENVGNVLFVRFYEGPLAFEGRT